jgi:hypothetical protein
VKVLADWLDQRFTIPGTSIRIGLDPILGLIPGIGDIIANTAGSAILLIAAQSRVRAENRLAANGIERGAQCHARRHSGVR